MGMQVIISLRIDANFTLNLSTKEQLKNKEVVFLGASLDCNTDGSRSKDKSGLGVVIEALREKYNYTLEALSTVF